MSVRQDGAEAALPHRSHRGRGNEGVSLGFGFVFLVFFCFGEPLGLINLASTKRNEGSQGTCPSGPGSARGPGAEGSFAQAHPFKHSFTFFFYYYYFLHG